MESLAPTVQKEPVNLNELISDLWPVFSDRALENRLRFQNNVPKTVTCISSKELFTVVLSNLLDNAVEYADPGGTIRIEGDRSAGTVILSVSNTGCRLEVKDAEHLFDSFWRGDQARQATGTHCGIGLSVVRRAVKAMGGQITAQIGSGGIFTAHLRLPTE